MSASYLDALAANVAVFSAAVAPDESYRSRSHAPPAAITLLAIGIESMRLPSGPLSEPPFGAPGTLNCTTASRYLGASGEARRPLYRTPRGVFTPPSARRESSSCADCAAA